MPFNMKAWCNFVFSKMQIHAYRLKKGMKIGNFFVTMFAYVFKF